jgi:RNA polymerase sigma factor (sigma-70 family)
MDGGRSHRLRSSEPGRSTSWFTAFPSRRRVEASALPERLPRSRAPLSAAFLRLRSDEQLVALFRAGSDDAFRAIHDRYRSRLLAYSRQMLHGALGDPEDALQDVFVRAFRALRASDRPVTLRAWLYRIAHNRCIDELRRPGPLPSELTADAQPAFSGPAADGEAPAVAERSATLARLVADVQTLPEQQRSALLMREFQGLTYAELGSALGVSVPAVKSLLLRARTGLIDISVARETPCGEIREELLDAADRSVRISGRARRHCSECAGCDVYRGELKRVRRGFASLTPTGPLGQLGMLLGLGGGGGAAAAGGGGGAVAAGSAAAGGGSAIIGATAAKIAVAVCCAALIGTAGGAVIEHASAGAKAPAVPTAHAASASPGPSHTANVAMPTKSASAVSPSSAGGAPRDSGGGAPDGRSGAAAGSTGATGAGPTGGTLVGDGPVGIGGAAVVTGATGSSGTTGVTGASGTTSVIAVNGIGGSSDDGGQGSTAPPTGASGTTGATGASGSDVSGSGASGTGEPHATGGGADGGTRAPTAPTGATGY